MTSRIAVLLTSLLVIRVESTFWVNYYYNYSKFAQPDDFDSGKYDFYTNSSLCVRPCNGQPKTCYWTFVVEHYTSMGPACGDCPNNRNDCTLPQCVPADGVEKPISVVNRRMPGPSIQVCRDDTIVVDVINRFLSDSTTIHWHGFKQRGSQIMDGVPMVTQCPINPEQVFRYKFKAQKSGTYFWHSHSGTQKVDGVNGHLIVRETIGQDPNAGLYDFDLPSHAVLVTDWMHTLGIDRFPGLVTNFPGQHPNTYLINGKGFFLQNMTLPDTLEELEANNVPIANFNVVAGKKYRFRIIGSTCLSCAVRLTIENHKMLVISTDAGNAVEPKEVDAIDLVSGDRFDVVINANQAPSTYWIHLRSIEFCESENITQVGLLKYTGGAPRNSLGFPGVTGYPSNAILNAANSPCIPGDNEICVTELKSKFVTPPEITNFDPYERFYFEFGFVFYPREELFQPGSYDRYFEPVPSLYGVGHINNLSNVLPSSPLLTQYDEISPKKFCSNSCPNPDVELCHCTNLICIPHGTLIEIVLIDKDGVGITHPFHLHGYEFYAMEMGVFNSSFTKANLKSRLESSKPSNKFATLRDTIGVPSGGYAVIRFIANNPGVWLFHCHFLYHFEVGMCSVFKVENPLFGPPPLIPLNFPRCGDFY